MSASAHATLADSRRRTVRRTKTFAGARLHRYWKRLRRARTEPVASSCYKTSPLRSTSRSHLSSNLKKLTSVETSRSSSSYIGAAASSETQDGSQLGVLVARASFASCRVIFLLGLRVYARDALKLRKQSVDTSVKRSARSRFIFDTSVAREHVENAFELFDLFLDPSDLSEHSLNLVQHTSMLTKRKVAFSQRLY